MNMIPDYDYNDTELMAFIGKQDCSQDIKTTTHYSDKVAERLKNGRVITGATLPWSNTHEHMRFKPGEVTVWAGMNGHKKSMLLGMITMWMAQTQKVGISSFEMPVIDTMERLISQAAGCHPSQQFAQEWVQWGHEKMYFYDQIDTVPTKKVLGSTHYMAQELGCEHIVIDSLTKCGLASGDKDAEKRFIDLLSAAAKAHKIHIHLVAHVRKPPQGGEHYIPNKFDIRGAGEITDLVHNVMICWTDKKKVAIERKREARQSLTDTETEYLEKNPDQRLICCKQRNGAWEGTIGLGFKEDSLQFVATSDSRPLPFAI